MTDARADTAEALLAELFVKVPIDYGPGFYECRWCNHRQDRFADVSEYEHHPSCIWLRCKTFLERGR